MRNLCPFCWREATETREYIKGPFRQEITTCLNHVKEGGEPTTHIPVIIPVEEVPVKFKPPMTWNQF